MKKIEITFHGKINEAKKVLDNHKDVVTLPGEWVGNTYFSKAYDENDEDEAFMLDYEKEAYKNFYKDFDCEIKVANASRVYGSYVTTKEFELKNGGSWM